MNLDALNRLNGFDLASLGPDQEPATLPSEFKTRRAHEKSRKGCIRCKQQRKKCDEIMPHCSRCVAGKYDCHYTKGRAAIKVTQGQNLQSHAHPNTTGPPLSVLGCSFPGSSEHSFDSLSSTSDTFPSGPVFSEQRHSRPHSSEILNATELALLSHYITHTSRSISFDQDDLYALQVGIPNLAFNNEPLMASLLSLAAVSKCCHMTKHTLVHGESWSEICELLVLADRYHRTSLQQIQATIPTTDRYEYVMLNAIFMAVYGCARHCVRIRLAKAAKLSDKQLPIELQPTGSQWISLLRAAHAAHLGLLVSPNKPRDTTTTKIAHLETSGAPHAGQSDLREKNDLSREDRLVKGASRFLLPIVVATYSSALEKLYAEAEVVRVGGVLKIPGTFTEKTSHDCQQQPVVCGPELQSCFTSMDILRDVFATVFSWKDPAAQRPQQAVLGFALPLPGPPPEAPSWLTSYLARVTSGASSSPIRRTVMGFVNRVPLIYMSLVQSILNQMPVEPSREGSGTWKPVDGEEIPPSPARHLAMNIFAHWLVLVMVLDDVWWIGGMGEWELARAVFWMRSQGQANMSRTRGEAWWPESMHNVAKSLRSV
ncbi:hypothetical protein AK830_g9060 [Neonectria ditissima]|uniref:Zn(2)-C6 fungal-type domain-containing protein n=1 Tax=Neonectria ditissima TaxID=78410 RepID=A0A0P7ASL6_9HYPO|nr:hypothetical protein AK830_g9060 [Neonectria ditissima]